LGPEQFGLYGVIISVLGWTQQTTRSSIPLAASRLVASEGPQASPRLRPTALASNLVLSLGVTLLFWVLAPALAQLLNAREATPLLRIAAVDIPLFATLHLYRGVAMGERRFLIVSVAGVSYGLAKLAGMCSLIFFGFSVAAALIANIIASVIGLVVITSRMRIALGRPDSTLVSSLGRLAVPLALSSMSLSILHYLDLWILKALTSDSLSATIGIYAAVGYVAKAPELALIAVASVLFPTISYALATNNFAQAQSYVRDAVRFLWVILLPVSVVVAVEAEPIMSLLFSNRYAGGGALLRLQIMGFGCLAFLVTFLSIMRAAGSFYLTVWIGFALAILLGSLALRLIPEYGAVGAASSLLATTATGSVVTGILVYRRFGALLPLRTVMRVVLATTLIAAVGTQIPGAGVLLVVKCIGLMGLYVVVLVLFAELKQQDLSPLLFWR
jgi:O-antigen/teichoic acid export membrane protein